MAPANHKLTCNNHIKGIEYDNKVEDADSGEPSYILFHPWQFKSIYNHGEFSKYKRNFLGSNSKYKKKEQAA